MSNRKPRKKAKRKARQACKETGRGFTLIELLVVMAILGVLTSLTIQGVSKGLLAAKRTKCLSNMRQIGLAVVTYSLENKGALPPTRHSASQEEAWIAVLRPYLGNLDEVRICPADPKGKERLKQGGSSYLANDVIFDPPTDPFGTALPGGVRGLSDIQSPTQTQLVYIVSDNRGTGASNDHTHANQWSTWNRFLMDVEADRFRVGGRASSRTRGDANYLYADGSVRTLKATVLKQWIESGKNPGLVNNAPP